MKLENMRAAADSDQIILYWDKPKEPGKQYEYEILKDGMLCGRIRRILR